MDTTLFHLKYAVATSAVESISTVVKGSQIICFFQGTKAGTLPSIFYLGSSSCTDFGSIWGDV